MARPRPLRLDVKVDSPLQLERVWNNLLAIDAVIDEIHEQSWTIIIEWDQPDYALVRQVKHVASVKILPPKEIKFEIATVQPARNDRVTKKPKKQDRGSFRAA